MKAVFLLASLSILTACVGSKTAPVVTAKGGYSVLANGRDIFMTGRDFDGAKLTAARPPLRPSCAACHGLNGAGGIHLPGGAVSADLRHHALIDQQKPPYSLALIERAISTGIDNTGQPLNAVMPRWRMSKRDLHDVAQYVLTQLR